MVKDSQYTVIAPPELDAAHAPAFTIDLTAPDPACTVVVDCSSVDFIDSSGLRAIVVAHNRSSAAGGAVRLVGATRVVRRVIELCGLEFLLEDGASATR